MTLCPHNRKRSIVVYLEPNADDREAGRTSTAVVTIQCHECGQPFEFSGVKEGPGLTLSADRRELRVMITEGRKGMVQ